MFHTFAHVFLRRLAYECGYSSNSLRERIYCTTDGDKVGGILIYTADSDSEGSMGGLVELGFPEKLQDIFVSAISDSTWCSSDPVCRESHKQGLDGLNKAACHACALVSETSCAHMNVFLDRVVLSGGTDVDSSKKEPRGFFANLVDSEVVVS